MKNKICFDFLSKNQEKIIVCLFLSSFFALGFLDRARYGLILFFVGFLCYFWNFLKKNNFKGLVADFIEIRWWVFSIFGLWIMSCVSLLFCFDIYQTSLMILKFLVIPSLMSMTLYVVFKNLNKKSKSVVAILLFIFFILHSFATVWIHLKTGNSRSVGIGDHSIIPYATYLIIAFAFSLSFLIFSRFKFFSFLFLCVSLFALYANGTRASIVAIYGIICLGFLYPYYRFKKIIICFGILLLIGASFALYQWSGEQKERFNFKSMAEKVKIVWDYAPAEMGRFDELCFLSSPYRCSTAYGEVKQDQRFLFEQSALARLSLNKSALLILAENKFIPIGYFPRFFNENISGFDERILPYMYYWDKPIVFYEHIHNAVLSAFLEMGFLGGLFYLSFFLVLMYLGWKNRGLYGGILLFSVFGVFLMSFFDSMLSYSSINFIFNAFCGILLGLIYGKKNENLV